MKRDQPHLIVVEDDQQLSELLVEYLNANGFEVTPVSSGDVAAERILETQPDLVVLDLMLPGLSGLDVCRRVRDEYDGAILMLTASQSDADHVAGLELGADDFVTKPIEPRVLLARIRAQLRRFEADHLAGAPAHSGLVEVGALRIDTQARAVHVEDRCVPLTTMEYEILLMLADRAGTVVERQDLYSRILGTEYDGIDRGMDVHVSRIRRKLEGCGFDPGRLKSVRGAGYLLVSR